VFIVVVSLLRGSWCRRCLLPGVVVDLSGVGRLLTCTWDSSDKLLLLSNSSSGVGVLSLLVLFICLSILRWYICRDNQDLVIKSLELFSWIVRGDSRAGDLEREVVKRRLSVQLVVMGRNEGSAKLL
jgi:hypothetical protein